MRSRWASRRTTHLSTHRTPDPPSFHLSNLRAAATFLEQRLRRGDGIDFDMAPHTGTPELRAPPATAHTHAHSHAHVGWLDAMGENEEGEEARPTPGRAAVEADACFWLPPAPAAPQAARRAAGDGDGDPCTAAVQATTAMTADTRAAPAPSVPPQLAAPLDDVAHAAALAGLEGATWHPMGAIDVSRSIARDPRVAGDLFARLRTIDKDVVSSRDFAKEARGGW